MKAELKELDKLIAGKAAAEPKLAINPPNTIPSPRLTLPIRNASASQLKYQERLRRQITRIRTPVRVYNDFCVVHRYSHLSTVHG